jgi:CDP-2,3-bis-(O-geranylgeranyl)-sn-glycerol synthase
LLLAAFTLAGAAQTAWFASPVSRAFAWPLDGGATFRGRRIFGANKTTRGLVVMVPAAAAAFVLMGSSALLGAIAGAGFMAGELPNSFVKRQLDIAPGAAPSGSLAIAVQFLFDRLDSGIGMLLALSLVVPVAWQTWAVVLIVGPFIHWSFSLVMFRLGLKARAA